jgi:F-type H+-transporting ATPase subunit b
VNNFLVPDATLVIEVVAFNLVLFVVAKFVLPRLRAVVEARQAQVKATVALKAETERLRRTAEEESRQMLAAAHRDARRITDQARATRDELIAQGRRDGLEEYRWLAGRAVREAARAEALANVTKAAVPTARRTSLEGRGQTLFMLSDEGVTRTSDGRMASPTAITRGEAHGSRPLSADNPADQPAEARTRPRDAQGVR